MKRIKQLIMSLAILLGVGLVLAPVGVSAVNVDPLGQACNGNASTVCDSRDDDISTVITTVINILLFIVGVISVIMIIVGGILYTTSAGEAGNITKAKNTILYAIIGLVVAFLAYAIVNWVVLKLIHA